MSKILLWEISPHIKINSDLAMIREKVALWALHSPVADSHFNYGPMRPNHKKKGTGIVSDLLCYAKYCNT